MRIALFGFQYFEKYNSIYQAMINQLEKADAEIWINHSLFQQINSYSVFSIQPKLYTSHLDFTQKPDAFISIGGDGTILDTITIVRDSNIPILGVNLGRLGFLSSVSHQQVERAIEAVLTNNYILDRRTLLSLKTSNNLFGDLNFALNELSIQKKDQLSMIVVHVYMNDQFLNSYWSDGLLISTPTGSTAYSLSVGGPIVTPGSENFIISPIATHNLTVRPIVIPDNSTLKLKIQGRASSFLVGLDSRFETVDSSVELFVMKSNFSINLIQIGSRSFFDTIREKLNWGLDVRN
jgi:NAD+ kinase